MKKNITYLLVLAIITLSTFSSCKKAVQDAVNNSVNTYLYSVLQSGHWTISKYSEGKNDSTAIYKNWETFFKDNNVMQSYKVDSLSHIIDSASGTWSNTDLSHFYCNYTTGAKYPLTKLSDNWTIDTHGTNLSDQVSLIRTINGVADTLQMQKH